jgi:hypothetical protein
MQWFTLLDFSCLDPFRRINFPILVCIPVFTAGQLTPNQLSCLSQVLN